MDEQLKDDTLSAIAVVTAALGESGENKTLAAQVAQDWVNENPDGAMRLTNGFVQLSMLLLTQLKLRSGDEAESALQVAASVINSWDDD